ncbi:2-keto-4-pentenoate hydratase/2-oxohepta-3-ene-1,7-dioic acid hydratase (catechol pathway) [Atopomonas hussainii]|uniref:2-keto-4-pentenoate hydratase/2-oxohepta-3-ene-1,7-dioic acid hydratase (Catechol pathway) n=1 Tax=Atopomonas hussainii TaxID=1429083 RepID=A0A1H7RVQ6_9GAMM|nr:fumarylacetoacetate hydrolase family protein [Atopomonas hussainii]SEL64099.1 2-keto-4-pentenoate hydratase/2-oxohepta-3-ene-1,7-dioic acid hydratase (catechol pathway) [Atopomonas hussainii]
MKRTLYTLLAVIGVWFACWQVAARWEVAPETAPSARSSGPALDTLVIAPRSEALTFARFMRGNEPHLLLVDAFQDGQVSGLDLHALLPGSPADPVALFNALGYAALQQLHGPTTQVEAGTLLLPFTGTDNQVAVGVNYREHAEETAVSDSFLFPKRTTATVHNAPVAAREHLLDYEVELGFVLLQDLPADTPPDYLGLVLASDYTDRAMLMRHVNLLGVHSGAGFTSGKSHPGFMPVGNLLVIPKDYEQFYPSLALELWHNGEQRQVARPSEMVWDIQRIMAQTFAWQERSWAWHGDTVRLPFKGGKIPARTVILSGTPGGVIYRKPSPRQLFLGVSEWAFSLSWLRPQAVVEPFIREEYRSGRYLQAGDQVVMRADRLGTVSNSIVAE